MWGYPLSGADTVKNALGQVDGVLKVKVHVGKKTIAVSVDEKAAINRVIC